MANREENLKKINVELEKLSDEELEQVAGGSIPQTSEDIKWGTYSKEAEACMAELADIKLDEATLEQVAGGQAAGGSPNKVEISDILKSTTAILMFP